MNRSSNVVRIVTLLVIACFLALPLGACGKKGSLDPPPGKKTEFPRQYPRR